jgi:hypothetical protein
MSALSAMSTVDLKVPLVRRSADELELAEGRVILERKTLGQVLLSRYGVALVVFVPLTMGALLAVFLYSYGRMSPRRVWLKGRRLFADSRLPVGGVNLSDVGVRRERHTLLGVITITRFLYVEFHDAAGKRRVLTINSLFFPQGEFDAALPAMAAALG